MIQHVSPVLVWEDQIVNPSCFDKIKRCGDRAKATAVPVDLWVGSMNPAEQREFVAEHMDSDLQFILDDSGVALGNMVAIARRYGSLRRFNALGDDRAGIRAACLADFAIPQDTPDNRAQVAAVVTAWETAQEYVSKEIELRAEAKVLGQPRILQVHERQAMVKAVENIYGTLSESETPSTDYLSIKAEETETNEPTASALDEILSRKEATTSQIQSSLDSAGHIKVVRTKGKGRMPTNTEEYRKLMKVEAYAWLCMASRYRAKHWLHGLTADPFTKFVDFILGDRVNNLQIPGASPEQSVRLKPDWSIVLAYEYKLRKEAMKLVVHEGRTLADAMVAVTRDADLKEAFFTTPVALKSSSQVDPPPNKWQRLEEKGYGKKGKKGKKGDGKGKKGDGKSFPESLKGLSLAWRTPDNRELCFSWNSGDCDGKCGRVHQCRVKGCYGSHKAIDHKAAVGKA